MKLHVFCQTCNYVVAPLVMLALLAVIGRWVHPDIRFGFFYLAILPTTIASAIILTSNSSGGDSSSALFSTTLSNILGVCVTPLLCTHFLHTGENETVSIIPLIGKLSLLVLLPIIIGQAIRPFYRN